jgi:hypothetical protein
VGAFFFRGFPHTDNLNIKIQRDTGKGLISMNPRIVEFET